MESQIGLWDSGWGNTGIPAIRLELFAEHGRTVPCTSLDKIQYNVGLRWGETTNEPLIQNQQINLLVSPHDFFQLLCSLAIISSSQNSGIRTYRTDSNFRQTASPRAQANYVLPLSLAPLRITWCPAVMYCVLLSLRSS